MREVRKKTEQSRILVQKASLITDIYAGDVDPSQGGVISGFIFKVSGTYVPTSTQ